MESVYLEEVKLADRQVWLAPGVRLAEINWYLECIIKCYVDTCNVLGVPRPCITGGKDEPPGHSEIDHQSARALDLRSRDFVDPEVAVREMKARLRFYGSGFVVKYLDVGHGAHFHVAWR